MQLGEDGNWCWLAGGRGSPTFCPRSMMICEDTWNKIRDHTMRANCAEGHRPTLNCLRCGNCGPLWRQATPPGPDKNVAEEQSSRGEGKTEPRLCRLCALSLTRLRKTSETSINRLAEDRSEQTAGAVMLGKGSQGRTRDRCQTDQ